MKLRKTAAALGACAAIALTVTACGSDEGGSSDTTTTAATATQDAGTQTPAQKTTPGQDESGLPPTPTVEQLNAQLHTALDPSVPVEQKADLVTGLEDDSALIQNLSEKVAEAEADGTVSDITVTGPILPPVGNTLMVPFEATFNGQTNAGQATLLAVDGKWRLDGDFLCGLAVNLGIESPACSAPAGS